MTELNLESDSVPEDVHMRHSVAREEQQQQILWVSQGWELVGWLCGRNEGWGEFSLNSVEERALRRLSHAEKSWTLMDKRSWKGWGKVRGWCSRKWGDTQRENSAVARSEEELCFVKWGWRRGQYTHTAASYGGSLPPADIRTLLSSSCGSRSETGHFKGEISRSTELSTLLCWTLPEVLTQEF